MEKEDVIIERNEKKFIRLYHFMPAAHFLDVLEKDEIKISLPEECNDPLEFLPAEGKKGEGALRPEGGFISFSERFDNSLMWAHYADSHRGVCLEFTFPVLELGRLRTKLRGQVKETTSYATIAIDRNHIHQYSYLAPDLKRAIAVEVAYRKSRPLHDNFVTFASYGSNKAIITLNIAAEIYTKALEWKYEKEWRMLVSPASAQGYHDGCFFVTGLTKYLSSVILGTRFDKGTRETWRYVYQSLKRNPHYMAKMHDIHKIIDMYRAVYAPREYKIEKSR